MKAKGGAMKFTGWFGIIVGFLMIGMWSFFLATGQVPEIQTEPFRITFHLAAEFTTAIALIIGGTGVLRNLPRATIIYFTAAGMLLYSLIVSPGYYAQQGQWPFVAMFAILLIVALVSIVVVARPRHT